MDLKQLEAFAQVVRLGSFSRAAERLYLTQPTVSAHIKALEEELGARLIDRAAREARPTEKGALLFGYAQEMLSLRDRAVAACAEAKNGALSGAVAVAASTVPYQHVLPRATAAFRAEHPAVTFTLTGCDSAGVVPEILSGRAEIGLTGTVLQSPQLLFQPFMDDELVVITPPGAPYDSLPEDGFRAEDLLKAPFIVREPGSGTRREVEALLAQKGVAPGALRVAAQMDNPDAIRSAVAQGLGVSVLSRLSCAEDIRQGRLRAFRIDGGRMVRRLYLVRHARRALSQAAEAFFRFMAG